MQIKDKKWGCMRGILWVLIWLASFACLQGMDHTEAMGQVKQWLRNYIKKERGDSSNGYYVITPQANWSLEHKITFTINQEKYTFIYAKAEFYTDDSKRVKDVWMCSGILFKGKLYKGFCLRGDFIFTKVVSYHQESYLTLIFAEWFRTNPVIPILAFKLIDNTFYLDYYGTQSIDSLLDHYCLSRDNSNRKVAMGFVNDKLLKDLRNVSHNQACGVKHPPQTPPEEILMGDHSYKLTHLIAYFYLDNTRLANCNYVKEIQEGFCFPGFSESKFVHKDRFLTLEDSYAADSSTSALFKKSYKYYFTFKEINGHLYLYQLSQQVFRIDAKTKIKELLNTDIFYRQPRDDPSAKNLITWGELSIDKLSKLETECRMRGLCSRE